MDWLGLGDAWWPLISPFAVFLAPEAAASCASGCAERARPFLTGHVGLPWCCSRLGSVPAVLACAAARGNPHRRALEALQSPVPLVALLPSEAARAVKRTPSQDPTAASAAAPSSVWPFPQSTRLRFPPPLRHFLVAQQKVRRLQDCSVSRGDPSSVCLSLRAARSSFSQVWVICCWTPCWAEGRGRPHEAPAWPRAARFLLPPGLTCTPSLSVPLCPSV